MNPKLSPRRFLASLVIAIGISYQPQPLFAEPSSVALPKIENNTVSPRLIYIENPRFPKVGIDDLWKIFQSAAALAKEHFGVTVFFLFLRHGELRELLEKERMHLEKELADLGRLMTRSGSLA